MCVSAACVMSVCMCPCACVRLDMGVFGQSEAGERNHRREGTKEAASKGGGRGRNVKGPHATATTTVVVVVVVAASATAPPSLTAAAAAA